MSKMPSMSNVYIENEWTPPNDAVVKLTIGDNEVRRIPASLLFKIKNKAYRRLVKKAIKYFNGDDLDTDVKPEDFTVKTTYVDEDDDVITFSTEQEFIDAWIHTQARKRQGKLGGPLILRVSAEVRKATDDKLSPKPSSPSVDEMEQLKESLKQMENRMNQMNSEDNRQNPRAMGSTMHPCGRQFMGKKRELMMQCMILMETLTAVLTNVLLALQTFLSKNDPAKAMGTTSHNATEEAGINTENVKSPPNVVYVGSNVKIPQRVEKGTPSKPSEKKSSATPEEAVAKEFVQECMKAAEAMAKNCSDNIEVEVVAKEFAHEMPKKCNGVASRNSQNQEEKVAKDLVEAFQKKALLMSICHRGIQCDGCTMNPIIGIRYHATNLSDYDLCELCYDKAKEQDDIQFESIEKPVPPKRLCKNRMESPIKAQNKNNNLDAEFVHGRHTCDGCMTTPIVGYRYHALNLKDYDLCSNCFHKYEGGEIIFEAVEMQRDRNRQGIWKKKFNKSSPQDDRDRPLCNTNEKVPLFAEDFIRTMNQAVNEALEAAHSNKPKVTMTEQKITQTSSSVAENSATSKTIEMTEMAETIDKEESPPIEVQKLGNEDETELEVEMEENKEEHFSQASSTSSNRSSQLQDMESKDSTHEEEEDIVLSDYESTGLSDVESLNENYDHDVAQNKKDEQDSKTDKTGTTNSEESLSASEEKSSGTADEWDMVDKDKDQTQNDEMLAQAAQMVGSALFEEDNSRFVDLINSSTADLDNGISFMQISRWQEQLVKLRELGFLNDKKSIDVLEELEAANIGVDSTDPIKIEKVVDVLLKNIV